MKNVLEFTHFHQFCCIFIGKDKVFQGLLYSYSAPYSRELNQSCIDTLVPLISVPLISAIPLISTQFVCKNFLFSKTYHLCNLSLVHTFSCKIYIFGCSGEYLGFFEYFVARYHFITSPHFFSIESAKHICGLHTKKKFIFERC